VQGQQSVKNFGMLAKNLKGSLLKSGTAIKHEHQPRHQQGASRQAAMRSLVAGEIARPERLGQRYSLAEGKTQTFACDRIDGAGSVAYQRNISSPDPLQFAIGGY
jgi:hypothetical protein